MEVKPETVDVLQAPLYGGWALEKAASFENFDNETSGGGKWSIRIANETGACL